MTIKKLPHYLINQLKAGEIVERPASIVKELVENSLDAGAMKLQIEVWKGGKERIVVRDDGSGISHDDLPLTIERYATSKIHEAHDLETLLSYGFRGEALSAIAEVSTLSIQSKVDGEQGYVLKNQGTDYGVEPVPFAGDHGTHVIIDALFAGVPVREKYLKSDATEWKYIRQLITTYGLVHYDKERILHHNGKEILHLAAAESLMERVAALHQRDRSQKRQPFERKDEKIHLWGLRGDASLHFGTNQYVITVVNGRPVHDKLLRKSIMQAYQRQIVPGSYPFAIVFVDIDPKLVDVNVHPRKMEVTFLDPGSIFNLVKQTIRDSLGDQKVSYSAFRKQAVKGQGVGNAEYRMQNAEASKSDWKGNNQYGQGNVVGINKCSPIDGATLDGIKQWGESKDQAWGMVQESLMDVDEVPGGAGDDLHLDEHRVSMVGQLDTMYILCQSKDGMLLIDQHALAERITFEQMRRKVHDEGFTPEVLLTPLTLDWMLDEKRAALLNQIGFDISQLSETTSVVYAVPSIFQTYRLDLPLVLQCLEGLDLDAKQEPYKVFGLILDEIMGMKACKASIKAGQRLSMQEMQQLIRDASGMIDGLFVCQHGRPSVVLIPWSEVGGLFDRH